MKVIHTKLRGSANYGPPCTWRLSYTCLVSRWSLTNKFYIFLNDSVVLYHSVKSPGYVYKFSHRTENEYHCCCRCREFGKQRSVTAVDDVVAGRKNPEDDHHPECIPIHSNNGLFELTLLAPPVTIVDAQAWRHRRLVVNVPSVLVSTEIDH